jgi:hypothetical protein
LTQVSFSVAAQFQGTSSSQRSSCLDQAGRHQAFRGRPFRAGAEAGLGTRVVTKTIQQVMRPLDRITLTQHEPPT